MQQEYEYLRLGLPESVLREEFALVSLEKGKTDTGDLIFPIFDAEEFCVFTVIDGSFAYISEDQRVILGKGEAMLLLNREGITAQECGSWCSAVLCGALAGRMLKETARQGGCFFPQSGFAISSQILSLFHAHKTDDAWIPGDSMGAFSLLLSTFQKGQPLPGASLPAVVAAAIGICQTEFAYLYGVEELAERLEVTKPYFIRAFTAAVGISPGKYLTRVRIQHAKALLQGEEQPLETVAAACGFSNANYFCKVFRRETGLSPREFAQSYQVVKREKAAADMLYVY